MYQANIRLSVLTLDKVMYFIQLTDLANGHEN